MAGQYSYSEHVSRESALPNDPLCADLVMAVDAYRNKQRSMVVVAGPESSAIPSHLETRVGKRRWNERSRGTIRTATPPPAPAQ
jgi:hypothetical protein